MLPYVKEGETKGSLVSLTEEHTDSLLHMKLQKQLVCCRQFEQLELTLFMSQKTAACLHVKAARPPRPPKSARVPVVKHCSKT